MTSQNPLLSDWDTPFEIPPFDQIKVSHFRAAFEAAIAAHNDEIEAIASNRQKPTFANTIEAMELAGDALSKVAATFFNLSFFQVVKSITVFDSRKSMSDHD